LKRAAKTAEIILKACDVSNVSSFCYYLFQEKNRIPAFCLFPLSVSTTMSHVVLNEALRERHVGYLQGHMWDDVVAKSLDVFRGFDIFKTTEGFDPNRY
jgi:broad specificity phosphatase PhoE